MLLNYRQYSGQGEPVLILHGLFGSLGNWGWHSRQLARQFQVFGVDLRNHGGSPHSDDMSYPLLAEDVAALLAHLGIESAAVVGHSMGGKVAMQLALTKPQLVTKLVVMDIAPVSYSRQAEGQRKVLAGMQALDLAAIASRTEAEAELAQFIADEATRKFVLTNLYRDAEGALRWRLNLAAIARNYDRLREKPEGGRPYLNPVLFVKGALSNYIQQQHRKEILELFPNASVKIIMQAGHWLHADKPQACLKILQDFLSQE